MSKIYVQRESHTTATRHTSLSAKDANDNQVLVGSDYPLPTRTNGALRLAEGNLFSVGAVNLNSDKLADDGSLYIAIAFASRVYAHIYVDGFCGGDAEGFFYEGAQVSGGTTLTPQRLNRSATLNSNSASLLNPTVTSSGNLVGSYLLFGGIGKKAVGSDQSSPAYILKPLTTYLFQLKNVSGSAQAAEMRLTWYEET